MKPPAAATILGLNPATVRNMVRDGRLRGSVIKGAKKAIIICDDDHVWELRCGGAGIVESPAGRQASTTEEEPRVNINALRRTYGQKTH